MTRPVVATLHLLVAVMNIPTKVGARAWAIDFDKLADRADVFGINEAGSVRAKRLYRRLAKERGYSSWGLWRGPNPIFWDTRLYRLHSARQVRLHRRGRGRLARRFPGFNGARYVTVVTLVHRATGREITFMCWHFVAPGWKVRAAWRAKMRRRSIATVREIEDAELAEGRPVVGFGDTNLRDPFDLGDGWLWLRGDGVDKLGVAVPEDVRLDGYAARQSVIAFPALTDHKHGISAAIPLKIGAAA
jgi:endonuclease/exonuclease/phosphatase family metal-dependent hydrolase